MKWELLKGLVLSLWNSTLLFAVTCWNMTPAAANVKCDFKSHTCGSKSQKPNSVTGFFFSTRSYKKHSHTGLLHGSKNMKGHSKETIHCKYQVFTVNQALNQWSVCYPN